MHSSKLEYVLSKMEPSTIEEFRKVLDHSFRKREQKMGKLLKLILKDVADQEKVYATLYPKKEFSEKNLRNLRSELFKRLTDYLAVQHFKDTPELKLYVAQSLNHIQATQYFQSILNRYPDEEGLPTLRQLDRNNRLREEILRNKEHSEGRKLLSFDALIENSEEAFVARSLYYMLARHEAHKVYNVEDSNPPPSYLWDTILERLSEGAWQESQLIQLYHALYKLVSESPQPENFSRVKILLGNLDFGGKKGEAQKWYTLALNYCVRNWNHGDDSMVEEIYQLYEEQLERGLLIYNGEINAWHFKTMVSCAIRLGKFDWTKDCIDRYGPLIAGHFRESLLHFCQGMMAFYQKQFEPAENMMNKVLQNCKDPFLLLDARSYLLRIYYEFSNEDGMDSLINSFRVFLYRHQHLSAVRLKNYHEFIRFFRRYISLPPAKSKRAVKLKEEIQQSPHQAGRDWLLEKISLRT